MRNNERYLTFTAAVPPALLEMPDLRGQLCFHTFSMTYIRDVAMITALLVQLYGRTYYSSSIGNSCAHHASMVRPYL